METTAGLFSESLRQLIVNKELNKYTLQLKTSEEIMLVLTQLQQDGIKVENMNISRPKLEDIFLKYLGR